MRKLFYKLLITLTKKLGPWVFTLFAWPIATGFFLFAPLKVAVSVRFYQALFPDKNKLYHIWCTWKQYHNFTHVFMDRFLIAGSEGVTHTSEGWERLKETVEKKKGAIILMSHMGNWETAAHLLSRKEYGMRLLLYMGIKAKEQIEKMQKESLSKGGVRIVAVDQDGGSPFDILEGIKFLREGGLVSLTGDRIWSGNERTVAVKFLDHQVHLPEAPHLFALLSGSPLFIFFSFRSGPKKYHFRISEPIYVRAASRADRQKAIQRSAQKYADLIERNLRAHPLQWYHFEPFLGRKLGT
ncbi:MAG: lysophospholipid acyltransferase family protein [Thermodesulfobacteriota bacterium]|nr:lysophospholipid acyltransferase family protein [Thermodesulfobacteriota bacterium]